MRHSRPGWPLAIVVAASLLGGGCDQQLKNDLGAPVACPAIEKSLNEGIAGTLDKVQVGDYVLMENKYFTFSSPWVKYQDFSDLVVEIYPHAEGKELHLIRTTVNYSGGTASKPDSKHVYGLATADYLICPEVESSLVTFHNFKAIDSKGPSPDPKCKGDDCTIRIREVRFDIADRSGGGEKRYNYVFKVSPDLPYLARFLSQCATSKQDVNGMDVPVTQCTDVIEAGNQPPETP